jgi:hypothetical protein
MCARCLQITRFSRNQCTRHELRRRYCPQGEDLERLMYPQLDAKDVEVRMQALRITVFQHKPSQPSKTTSTNHKHLSYSRPERRRWNSNSADAREISGSAGRTATPPSDYQLNIPRQAMQLENHRNPSALRCDRPDSHRGGK